MEGKVEAKTVVKIQGSSPLVELTELLTNLRKGFWQCWRRRERPILLGRSTIHDGPQENPMMRGSREESSQKTQGEQQQLISLHMFNSSVKEVEVATV